MDNKKEPLVTIMMPTYNGSKYVEETIRSVLHQTHNNIKLLITDDASSDNTSEIVKSIKDPRIKFYQNKHNLGLAKNINTMVRNASGDFCIVLGQDDLLPPDHLACMLKQFIQSDAILIHCNARYIDENGQSLDSLARDDQKQILYNQNPLKALAFDNYIQSCGMMFRSKSFIQSGGWNEKYHLFGEWLWYIKMAKNGAFGYCTETLPSYRKHDGSTMQKINRERTLNVFFYQTHCRFLAFKCTSASVTETLSFYKHFLITTLRTFKKLISVQINANFPCL